MVVVAADVLIEILFSDDEEGFLRLFEGDCSNLWVVLKGIWVPVID